MTANYTPIDDLIQAYAALKTPTPAISIGKEVEPIKRAEALQMHEVVEHEPDEEVKKYTEIRPETIKLPSDLKAAGLQAVETTKFPHYKSIPLPLTDDKIAQGMHAPINSSLRWLATFSLYLLEQTHLTIKEVHGKVIRVIKK